MLTTPSPPSGGTSPQQPRRPASAVPSIKGLQFSPMGARATLVDISASGLLAECGTALKAGQEVTVVFEGTFVPASVDARVARSCVASMTPAGVLYHIGIAFEAPIRFENEAPPEKPAGHAPAKVAVADPPRPPLVNRW